jgi:hypothetical protein
MAVYGGIDPALDQPGKRHPGKIGGHERKNPEDQKAAIAIDQEFDAVVVAKNRSALLLRSFGKGEG